MGERLCCPGHPFHQNETGTLLPVFTIYDAGNYPSVTTRLVKSPLPAVNRAFTLPVIDRALPLASKTAGAMPAVLGAVRADLKSRP